MSQSLIFKLPLELLEEIADTVDLNTQLSLCCVSKVFHSLTVSSVYRVIYLDSPSTIVACCHTLAHNWNTATAVRIFSIVYTPNSLHYFTSFYCIIQAALKRLPHLQELRLMVPDPHYITVLGHAYFHSLRHFECYLPLTDSLVSFLNHHPTIIYLQIAPAEAPTPPTPSLIGSVLPGVVLPKLQYFVGNSKCVSALVTHTSLRAAFIFWEIEDGAPQDAITSLELSSGDTINLVSCRRCGWNLDLIDLISLSLPNIYVLIITNVLLVDSHPNEAYLNAIASLLARFSMLQHLHLHCVDPLRPSDIECNLDDDCKTVVAWGTACPSLIECILPHSDGMKWIRRHEVWIPDPNHPHGVDWTWNMLCSNKHPQWNRLRLAVTNQLRKSQNYAQHDLSEALRSIMLEETLELPEAETQNTEIQ